MRTLKYAILGLLSREDMTGYDIAKIFNAELANFWNAKHSQIYPELKRLTEEGLVTFHVVVAGDVLEKKMYSISERGRKELHTWLIKDELLEPTPKDKFRLRAYFGDQMDTQDLCQLVESQRRQRRLKLEFLSQRLSEYVKVPKAGTDRFGDYILLEGAVMREETYIAWLEKVQGYLLV